MLLDVQDKAADSMMRSSCNWASTSPALIGSRSVLKLLAWPPNWPLPLPFFLPYEQLSFLVPSMIVFRMKNCKVAENPFPAKTYSLEEYCLGHSWRVLNLSPAELTFSLASVESHALCHAKQNFRTSTTASERSEVTERWTFSSSHSHSFCR